MPTRARAWHPLDSFRGQNAFGNLPTLRHCPSHECLLDGSGAFVEFGTIGDRTVTIVIMAHRSRTSRRRQPIFIITLMVSRTRGPIHRRPALVVTFTGLRTI